VRKINTFITIVNRKRKSSRYATGNFFQEQTINKLSRITFTAIIYAVLTAQLIEIGETCFYSTQTYIFAKKIAIFVICFGVF
jgi:hypothetical protein